MVREALDRGHGGRIVTPNVDILRQARRRRGRSAAYLDDADLVVADGMPLVWASRLGGTPLPERVTGSSLIWSLSAGLAADGRSVFVLGGDPATRLATARRAAARLAAACPGLRIAGHARPAYGFDRDPGSCTRGLRRGRRTPSPTWSSSALGFPKQERVISRLRDRAARGPGSSAAARRSTSSPATRTGRRAGCSAPAWSGPTGWAPNPAGSPAATSRHDAPYALRLLAAAAPPPSADRREALTVIASGVLSSS